MAADACCSENMLHRGRRRFWPGSVRVGKVQSECAPAPSSRAFSCSLQLPDFCIGRDDDVSFTSGKRSESTMAPPGVPRGTGKALPASLDPGAWTGGKVITPCALIDVHLYRESKRFCRGNVFERTRTIGRNIGVTNPSLSPELLAVPDRTELPFTTPVCPQAALHICFLRSTTNTTLPTPR